MDKSDLKLCPICLHGLEKDVWTEDFGNVFHIRCSYCGDYQLFGFKIKMEYGLNISNLPGKEREKDPILSIAVRQQFEKTNKEVLVSHKTRDELKQGVVLPKKKQEYVDIFLGYLSSKSSGAFDEIDIPYTDYPLLFLKDEKEFEDLLNLTQQQGYIEKLQRPEDGYYRCNLTTLAEAHVESLNKENVITPYLRGAEKKLTVLVSSTVYDVEELLERIYTILTSLGYEVWMSHKGTVPVYSSKSNIDNCLQAVERCDIFLSIITNRYGSGIDKSIDKSITHIELEKAIELQKPRWVLAHDHVVFARQLLKKLGYKNPEERNNLSLKKSITFEDLKIIDMYELAINDRMAYEEKKGDWVQTYSTTNDAALFASAQFHRYQEIEEFIKEQFSNQDGLKQTLKDRGCV